MIVIVALLLTLPLATVATPLPLATRLAARALILTIVPAPSLMSGLASGKLFSLGMGTKPPTSVTTSTIRSLTA